MQIIVSATFLIIFNGDYRKRGYFSISKEHTDFASLLPKLTGKIHMAKVKLIYLLNNTLETNFKIFVREYTLESSTMIFSDTNIYTMPQTQIYVYTLYNLCNRQNLNRNKLLFGPIT